MSPQIDSSSRINLLITKPLDPLRIPGQPLFAGLGVVVRYGYKWLHPRNRAAEGRMVNVCIPCCSAIDYTVQNNAGQLGAWCLVIDDHVSKRVVAAVETLLAVWGTAIPVQDNSGQFSRLATAQGVLVI